MTQVVNHETGETQEFKMLKKAWNDCGVKELIPMEKREDIYMELIDGLKFSGKFVYKNFEFIKK
jgi:hypothetical protein